MLFNKRLPNTTVKFPDKVLKLIKKDAQREGHNNRSHVVRRIVMQYYKLIPVTPETVRNGGRRKVG